jgi:hypothetical protein
MRPPNPTTITYKSLDEAYAFFNRKLFAGRLPSCLITMQRSKSAYGYRRRPLRIEGRQNRH